MLNERDKRTYQKMGNPDLKEMKEYGLKELNRFLHDIGDPKGKYKVYKNKLVAICLCQGAAKHILDGKSGIKDIDIWLFFRDDVNVKIPDIKNMRYTKWGSFTRIGKKRMDFMKKGIRDNIINKAKSKKPDDILYSYLRNSKTLTSKELAQKAVIGLYPEKIFGKVIWP
jgi:hypothetical protein